MTAPSLSIIIPIYNEAQILGDFIRAIIKQESTNYELIFVDGGSTDDSLDVLRDFSESGVKLQILSSPAGRALQMNLGASRALGSFLLFLHIDSLFASNHALHEAETQLLFEQERQDRFLAGHFPIRFQKTGRAYYYYECKTHLNRRDCVNGDQGFLMHREYFAALGGFDESDGYMEDARLARRIYEQNAWITLSPVLYTSARRFESEGLVRRQLLNAIICNMDHIGLKAFISQAANAYRQQSETGRLSLLEFFHLAHALAVQGGWRRALSNWWKTGAYVADNVWQLFFLWDCNRNFRKGNAVGQGGQRALAAYDRFISPLIRSWPGVIMVGFSTLLWFYLSFAYFRLTSSRP